LLSSPLLKDFHPRIKRLQQFAFSAVFRVREIPLAFPSAFPYIYTELRNALKRFLTLTILSLFIVSCDDNPVFPIEPEIEFISITPDAAQEFEDELTITIHFQDGDGDLGYETDPVANLFIRDMRVDIPDSVRDYTFSIPNLTPDTRKPSIQGPISVRLLCPVHSSWFTLGSTENEVRFEVYIVDRAGHVSNTITTTPITILQ
jgi:hypothetical protein